MIPLHLLRKQGIEMNVLQKRVVRIPLIALGVIAGIMLLTMVVETGMSGYTPTDKHGRGPRDVVQAYEKATKESDGITLKEVAQDKQARIIADVLDINFTQNSQLEVSSPGYVMEEYKIDSSEYWYHLKWQYQSGTSSEEGYRVVYDQERDEWRLEEIEESEFAIFTEGLKPEIIRRNPYE